MEKEVDRNDIVTVRNNHSDKEWALIWAKIGGYPWWPGMISKDPVTHQFKKTNQKGTSYSVQFISRPPSRGWVKESTYNKCAADDCKRTGKKLKSHHKFRYLAHLGMKCSRNIKVFEGRDVAECQEGGIYYSSKKSFQASLTEAEQVWSSLNKEKLSDINMVQGGVETYGLGKKIPMAWKTAYVLMNIKDIPEGLAVGDRVKVPETGKKSKKKSPEKTKKVGKRKREVDESQELDSSPKKKHVKFTKLVGHKKVKDKPGKKTPKGKGKKKVVVLDIGGAEKEDKEKAIGDDEEYLGAYLEEEESEEDISCSDEEDWMPASDKNKKEKGFFPSSKKRSKPQALSKTKPKPAKSAGNQKQAVKLTTYSPPVLVESTPKASEQPQTTPPAMPLPTPRTKTLIIKDLEATGPEPEIGEFLIEKTVCKSGDVPFLWGYKKGGLIQKYEKKVEEDQTYYQNVLSYADWWGCYSHKYQKVETKVIYKYRTVEKIMLLEIVQPPSEVTKESSKDSDSEKSPPPTNTGTPDENTTTDKDETATTEVNKVVIDADKIQSSEDSEGMDSDKGEGNTQEQEISSTTPDSSDFQDGQFLLDKKDERNTDGYPIWRVENSILLRKYAVITKKGEMYHEAVKSYRGFNTNDISKFYTPIKVRKVPKLGSEVVEVLEESRPKIIVDLSMEEEYDQHPLLSHFYVYLQIYLSQALEPGFVTEVLKSKNDSYLFPMGEIDKIISQKIMGLERKCRWANPIKNAMQKRPYLREVFKTDTNKTCEAIENSKEKVEENVFLYGPQYDPLTLETKDNTNICENFVVGANAIKQIRSYHQLCHFKYNLYEICIAKINLIRERKADADVTEVMDACLGNKAWVFTKFEDFMNLIEMGP